jgi:hypothetical protein
MARQAPHAFLTAYGGGHISMVLPVCRGLRDRGWRVTLLALTTAAQKAAEAGDAYIGYSDLMHLAAPRAADWANRLCPNPDPSGPVSIKETMAYHGANFADLVDSIGEEAAFREWTNQSRQAFLPVDFMTRVLQEYVPDIVIATNSPRTERAAIMAASRLGIPSLCMVDLFALHEVKWIGEPGFANRVTVLNEAVRALMIAHGRSAEEVIVTGNPAFDVISSEQTVRRGARLRAERGWDDELLTIFWASTVEPERHPFTGEVGDPELPRQIERQLRELIRSDKRCRLVVRYHPSEQVQFVPEERVEFSPVSEPLHSVLHAVDVVVVTASTVGLEAWLAGRPVISVDLSIFTPDAPYSKMGISLGTASAEKLTQLLQDMAGKPVAFPLSGQALPSAGAGSATDAIIAEIEKITYIDRSN